MTEQTELLATDQDQDHAHQHQDIQDDDSQSANSSCSFGETSVDVYSFSKDKSRMLIENINEQIGYIECLIVDKVINPEGLDSSSKLIDKAQDQPCFPQKYGNKEGFCKSPFPNEKKKSSKHKRGPKPISMEENRKYSL